MSVQIRRTSNAALQQRLDQWRDVCVAISELPAGSAERSDLIRQFTRTFVPGDVTEDDIDYFSSNLAEDEEYFLSVKRDLEQCSSGEGVESIQGNQKKKAVYTLKPMEGLLTPAEAALDLVKELCFVYSGSTGWRAEG